MKGSPFLLLLEILENLKDRLPQNQHLYHQEGRVNGRLVHRGHLWFSPCTYLSPMNIWSPRSYSARELYSAPYSRAVLRKQW